MTNLSDEVLLILECCKQNQEKDKIKEYIKKQKNWQKFISLANTHGVLPLVNKTLKSFEETPLEVKSELKVRYLKIVQENMLLASELTKIMKLLEDNKIEALSFKGPSLSLVAYGDITLRQYIDLDIFIKLTDFEIVKEVLEKNNYRQAMQLNDFEIDFRKKNSHELSFYNLENNVFIEIHWDFVDSDSPMKFDTSKLFKNKSQLLLNNNALNILSNEYTLIYLCVHGLSHLYERIEWIVDIDRFIRNNYIDWDKIKILIKNSKEIQKSVNFSFYYANYFFQTPISKDFLKEDFLTLCSKVNYKLSGNSNNMIKDIFIKTSFFSSKINKLKYLHKMFFKPTLNEIRHINLDEKYYFLYYFLRFYLLIKKNFKR